MLAVGGENGPPWVAVIATEGDPKQSLAMVDSRSRIAILVRLAEAVDDRTVGQIAEVSPVDTSVVSRHLAALRDAGIVEATRRGKEVYHRVRYRPLAATFRARADAIEACCPSGG